MGLVAALDFADLRRRSRMPGRSVHIIAVSDGYRSAPEESHLSLLCVVAIRLRLAGSTLEAFTPDLQHPERPGLCSLGQQPAILNTLFSD